MRACLGLLALLLAAGCTGSPPPETGAAAAPPKIRNVIFMIGDGMGPQQVGLLELYAERVPGGAYPAPTALHQLMDAGYVGISRHDPAGGIVVDSACSASQLATGRPSLSESIGLDATGNPAETVLEIAMKTGRATGLVSDTRLTHATPAAFAAHVPYRDMENEIAVQLLATGPDVMLSGGLRHFLPRGVNQKDSAAYQQAAARVGDSGVKIKSKREDEEDLLARAEAQGYALVFDRAGLLSAASGSGKLLGLFSDSGMMDGIAHHQAGKDPDRKEPSLRDMTEAALQRLSQDEDGFFLMVEGGQIDWAAHSNDAGTMLHEMIKFDEAIRTVYEWARQRDDTLVVITADHETGGFGLSYANPNPEPAREIPGGLFVGEHAYAPKFNFGAVSDLEGLYAQQKALYPLMFEVSKAPSDANAAALAAAVNAISAFDITPEDARIVLEHGETELTWCANEDYYTNLIGRAMGPEQNVVWATGTHTHTPVPVVAWGPDAVARPFSHMLHHTEIGQMLIAALR